jgi:large subunit ribosomal protein L30
MGKIRVTQVRSTIKRPQTQIATLHSLGLFKLHQTVEHEDVPVIRGMIRKVTHLVSVEEVK